MDLTLRRKNQLLPNKLIKLFAKLRVKTLSGVLAVNAQPLVSIDFNHCPASSTFDETQTRVIDNLVKVISWYDNEWGFANRMLDTAEAMAKA